MSRIGWFFVVLVSLHARADEPLPLDYFIRANDLDDTFKIAALLAEDDHELVQKAVGSWLREAGKKDTKRLVAFLKVHARAMPRPMLRYAVEKLAPEVRTRYL